MNAAPVPTIRSAALLCGEVYTVSFNAGTYLYVEGTTASTPIVVTVPNHGYSNGETKLLEQCQDKAANGTWVIGNVTTNTFTLTGSAGIINGNSGGVSITPYDISGKTVRATLRANANGEVLGRVLDQQFMITVNDATLCDITLTLSHANTKAIQGQSVSELYCDVWADEIPLAIITFPVVPAGTVF
jgi:hypothetical protein